MHLKYLDRMLNNIICIPSSLLSCKLIYSYNLYFDYYALKLTMNIIVEVYCILQKYKQYYGYLQYSYNHTFPLNSELSVILYTFYLYFKLNLLIMEYHTVYTFERDICTHAVTFNSDFLQKKKN